MSVPDDALTQAGQILYSELPEEYRYRDNRSDEDLGDLEAYLHGFGHLLDLVRATTEQAYADAFAEETDTGHQIQPWLLPYLAELVGAELLAPDESRRRDELNNSVLWSKSKGTLHNVDQVSDVISGAETVVREGWRLSLTCPRPGLPPFSVPKAADMSDTAGRTPEPLGCPDFRASDRAVLDPAGGNPLYRIRIPRRTAEGTPGEAKEHFWKPRALGGVSCFPGGYADASARCPDLRDTHFTDRPGPHPGRSLIHIRPPDGLFETGLRVVELNEPALLEIEAGTDNPVIDPAYVLEKVQGIKNAPHDRICLKLKSHLNIPAKAEVRFENILFTGTVGSGQNAKPVSLKVGKGARVSMLRCAAEKVTLPGNAVGEAPDVPAFTAESSLFGSIIGANRFVRLVYCTVMQGLEAKRLQASDCLLNELSPNLDCDTKQSCIRYSRFAGSKDDVGCFSNEKLSNTQRQPRFIRRYLPMGKGRCVLRLPRYGEPGYGVLDILTNPAISAGAEDDGEMGVYHDAYFAAQVRALRKKLEAYLPLGQEVSLAYDPLLALIPPQLAKAGED